MARWHQPYGKEECAQYHVDGVDASRNDVITYRNGFATLWDSINAKRGYGWDDNPLVWVVEFEKVD